MAILKNIVSGGSQGGCIALANRMEVVADCS